MSEDIRSDELTERLARMDRVGVGMERCAKCGRPIELVDGQWAEVYLSAFRHPGSKIKEIAPMIVVKMHNACVVELTASRSRHGPER